MIMPPTKKRTTTVQDLRKIVPARRAAAGSTPVRQGSATPLGRFCVSPTVFKGKLLPLAMVALVATAAIIGASTALPAKAADKAPAKAAPAKPALTVTTTTARNLRLPQKLVANGNLAAWQEAIIGAEANGLRIRELHVAGG